VTTILAFLFVLGVLIFVHELGHFLAARRVGVRVLTFSLGFGPKLLKFKRGDTEYCISAVPLGGYVKMAGDSAEDERAGLPDEFLSKSKWERFQILIMGPVMNIVLAIVVLAVVLAQGAEVPVFEDQAPVVGKVNPGSPSALAGLQRGDRLLTIGGDAVPSWKDAYLAIATRANRDVAITADRGGQPVSFTVRPKAEGRYEIGDIGVLPDVNPSVRSVVAGDPADRAGLKAGDTVLAVNGDRMVRAQDLSEAISGQAGRSIDLLIRRQGAEQHITVVPEQRGDRGIIGIGISEETRSFKPGPVDALRMSVVQNWSSSGLIFSMLTGLVTGETSVRQLQGPVGIAQLSGESAQAGWVALLALMAVLSLNLGILNLMPIPVLDGGHILIMALEGVARRDFSMQVKEKMLLAGFVAIMMLMVTVIYNDLTRVTWIERFMPWRN
jgi:regulator of sigma E protease